MNKRKSDVEKLNKKINDIGIIEIIVILAK